MERKYRIAEHSPTEFYIEYEYEYEVTKSSYLGGLYSTKETVREWRRVFKGDGGFIGIGTPHRFKSIEDAKLRVEELIKEDQEKKHYPKYHYC